MYPLGLRLSGRRVLVVGGGAVAHRRVPRLLSAGADVMIVAPRVHNALRAMADSGSLRWAARGFLPSDVAGAWLVLAATDDPAVNAAVSTAAEAERIFCVRADDASAASAWTPAVTTKDELTVAAFASGDPRRAAALRDEVAGLIDSGLRVPRFRPVPGAGVSLVGAGPGDPELITVAGRRAVAGADVVIADRLAPARLLEELGDDVELVDAAKIPYGRQLSQQDITALMVDRARAGLAVVRLKGGDGFVFGRGGEELDACLQAGVPVRVIPGVSAAIAAPALAGVPVTERGMVHEFTVVSGHLAPSDPDSLVDWPALAQLRGTLVLLMAVRHLEAIVETLLEHGRDPATPVMAIMNASTQRQETLHGELSQVADWTVASPAVVVIGEVARRGREKAG